MPLPSNFICVEEEMVKEPFPGLTDAGRGTMEISWACNADERHKTTAAVNVFIE